MQNPFYTSIFFLFKGLISTRAPEYAVSKLTAALDQVGYTVGGGSARVIHLSLSPSLAAEEFSITPRGKVITVRGGVERGLIYGSLALAESLRNGVRLQDVAASHEKPKLPFRAIKFNLPWSTYRPSSALDQQ